MDLRCAARDSERAQHKSRRDHGRRTILHHFSEDQSAALDGLTCGCPIRLGQLCGTFRTFQRYARRTEGLMSPSTSREEDAGLYAQFVIDLRSPISFRRACMYIHKRAQQWASKARTVLVGDTKARAHASALHLPHCSPLKVGLFYCRSNGSSNATTSTASPSMRRCPEQEWQSTPATWRNRPSFERSESAIVVDQPSIN